MKLTLSNVPLYTLLIFFIPICISFAAFSSNNPNDYYYGISNNTCTAGAGYSTLNTWTKPDPLATLHRVFPAWNIISDHTGAAVSTTAGNLPAFTVTNNNGGICWSLIPVKKIKSLTLMSMVKTMRSC